MGPLAVGRRSVWALGAKGTGGETAKMPQLYDTIGVGYGSYRRPDPRLTAAIMRALGELAPIVNVGAGTGSYEPSDRPVVAVEPAMAMIRQRQARTIPVVQASATHLPFRDDKRNSVRLA